MSHWILANFIPQLQWHYAWAVRRAELEPSLVTPDERVAQLEGGSETDLSALSATDTPFMGITPGSSTPSMPRLSSENNAFIASPLAEGHERMAEVGAWAAQSTEVSVATEADSESEHGSEEDFVDADSDGDLDIESVTEV
jgi:hypothetical protein